MNITLKDVLPSIPTSVTQALKEDIGSGDITAELIPENQMAKANVISRESGILCGTAWVNEVYQQLDSHINLNWQLEDGNTIEVGQTLFTVEGTARALLTGERCALNFLQTLSGTASLAHEYASLVNGSTLKILDTRKTIPGLRLAQKYAIACGGCHNHRIGLYDAFLIKENHIAACGSITQAITRAKKNHPKVIVEVEVEDLKEFEEAQKAGADIIMLDNFSLENIHSAVKQRNTHCKIEVSGGLNTEQIPFIAKTGVDYISIGALTKHCRALDLSFRIQN